MTAPFRGSNSGLTRQRLRSVRFDKLGRDLYTWQGVEVSLRQRAEAAQLVLPGSLPCLWTAAVLQRLPVDPVDGLVHLARDRAAAHSERSSVRVHRLAVRPDELLDLDGLLVTDGPRTFADLAAWLTLEELVAVGDGVVRRYGPAAIEVAVARCRRRPGVVLLRQAATLLDPGADSPAETRGRLRLHAAGFTALRHHVVVRDQYGGWLGEPDLADQKARVAWQYEGEVHFLQGAKRRRRDLARDEVVRAQHWQVVCSTAEDDADPSRLMAKMTAAYLRAGHLWGRQVLPPQLR